MNFADRRCLTEESATVLWLLLTEKSVKKIEEAEQLLYETFADDGESYIPTDTVEILKSCLPRIAAEDFKKVTIQLNGGVKASLKLNSNGKIEIERTDTLKIKNETNS